LRLAIDLTDVPKTLSNVSLKYTLVSKLIVNSY
jgi:hypothetical protein